MQRGLGVCAGGVVLALPTDPDDIKNPGSVVGGRWQDRSSRDFDQIRRWWAENPQRGIALHCGPSGAVVFDLDRDDFNELPEPLAEALRQAEGIQLTRDGGVRGHYVFAMPPGESFGNRAGAFAILGGPRQERRDRRCADATPQRGQLPVDKEWPCNHSAA